MEVLNAQIIDTKLGLEDHGVFTFGLHIRTGDGKESIIGGYSLDYYDCETQKYVFRKKGIELIYWILNTVGVENWEDLNGKYIRIKLENNFSPVCEIGNLMDDSKWLNFKKFFEDE